MRAQRPGGGTLARKRTILLEKATRESTAPRFVGWSVFSEISGVDTRTLSRRLRTGTVWIPTPAVLLGEQERPGWELEVLLAWTPKLAGVERPEPLQCLGTRQMRRRYRMGDELLWICIVEDRTLPMPVIWLDGKPGWSIPEETPVQKGG